MAKNSYISEVNSSAREGFIQPNSIPKKDLSQKYNHNNTLKDNSSLELFSHLNDESIKKNDSLIKGDSEVLFNWKNFSPMNSFDQNMCSFDPRNDPPVLNQLSDENLELTFSDYHLEASVFGLGSHPDLFELESQSEYSLSQRSSFDTKKSTCYNDFRDKALDTCNVEFEAESETYMGKFMGYTAIYKNLRKPSLTMLLDSGNYISKK